ncbi:hypothetical protein [Vulcanisaeta souniana]|uniref:HNH nuclease domain-containing protein n=1 Tax=Vulcanisaeta souniana JCM 11219 TaxID=1293586 RepID=A0ABM8BQA3_9CREN|nr:hypothetical protein [Vulcanisaeta souniana]BDR93190.1 hypothetical protein Vsou_22830 [Vulcanisaeta souniana JCM 11219]
MAKKKRGEGRTKLTIEELLEYEKRRVTCVATGHCVHPMLDVVHIIPGDP